ncbi:MULTISPECIES: carbohydrate ABC transporter permease [Streptomyces]|uniref:carbohydrate ABC transporter permease n=1 Tax=Streptomyces TaxID=1883 RepID=UPI0004C9252E|nr:MULTISPECIES: carbohydrate ABC transporter permease [Streptomyces]MCD9902108.1 carbohydrate ABC transporter permease [Streptomyces sp. MT29]NDZ67136.1 carbohydrate ABC transporter permease [Streptomyces cyaneofuscatus]ONI55604.1 Trehalose transport system permease protein SugB [Streptomyces sp. IB2014 011-1]RDV53451.1 carbohydrate ABC transporter permease [Streptomyces sp. IB2014 011-12]CAD5946984.1 Trehalose transport system permease protein SugB [Streptomyces sp. KY70]
MSSTTKTQALRPDRKKSRLHLDILGLGIAVVMIFPVYWLVISSLRPNREIRSYNQTLWPTSITFDNFARAVDQPNFTTAIQSSLIVAVTAVVGGMIIATLAALAIGRFRFFGRKPLLLIMILVQMLPPTAMLIPIYAQLNAMGGIDEYWGLIVVYLVATLPFATIMIRGFVVNIPVELEESAMVDGLTRFGAFRKVVFPLLAPGLAAASIFALVNAWNEYLFAYILINDNSKYTLNVWLMTFTTERGTDYGALMAASTMIALPVVIFFMIIQKKMAAGLTSGAVKG